MTVKNYCERIGDLVGKDDLKAALQELHLLLNKSPKLDEAIIQSARYNDIMKEIRLGTVSFKEANQTKNQIRLGILNLLAEIEEQANQLEGVRSEIEAYQSSRAIIIRDSKNAVNNSFLKAGGGITIGDYNTNNDPNGNK